MLSDTKNRDSGMRTRLSFKTTRSPQPNACSNARLSQCFLSNTCGKPIYEQIRDQVKEKCPDCKIVLIVDENAEREVANQVKQSKKDGLIDQFIYGSISASYLADIVDSL